jgi:hypothetical protein
MIACPVKSSERGLPKAVFNRLKLMIENIFKHQYVKISEVAIIFNKKGPSARRGLLKTYF